jgi:Ca2+-transporting ATPase
VLILAGLISFALHDFIDALVILFALAINLGVSLWQEGKAANVFALLQKETQHMALVIRDGKELVIPAAEVVVGDIIVLTGGTRIPADARAIEVHELAANESALTGEWTAQKKTTAPLAEKTRSQEMTNMVWAGTYVAEGHGKALVVSVGEKTMFGSLALSATELVERPTPLQDKLNGLSRTILLLVGVIAACIFIIGVMRGELPAHMLLVALAVGVAAMPEGLPAVMTVVLAQAMQRILKKGGLVKRLVSAETFGSVTTIITDKTGTLTTGEMVFSGVVSADGVDDASKLSPLDREVLADAVRASDAFIEEVDTKVTFNGRALEVAIVAGGYKNGIDIRQIKAEGHQRIQLVQFEASRRFAISLNTHPEEGARIYLTGSPEHILAVCSSALTKKGVVPLTQELQDFFAKEQSLAAAEGKRFTAVAYRASRDRMIHEDIIHPQHGERLGFIFSGLLLFEDTIRPDVAQALRDAKDAGVRVIMATGDHPGTGVYVAEKVGLLDAGEKRVITGDMLESMSDGDIIEALKDTRVFARVLPQHKMRLAHVLQSEGEVVAMTGDGINDAPALVAADIGVTLSTGTDIAKEASDLVLMKDSFSVIIDAIREGRRAIANIRTIVSYLLSMSLAMVVLIGGALVGGIALPLLPAQILWINIVVEGFMSFPFAMNPLRKSAMLQKAYRRADPLFSRTAIYAIAATATLIGLYMLGFFAFIMHKDIALESARTTLFITFCIGAMLASFSFLDTEVPLWRSIRVAHSAFRGALSLSCILMLLGAFVPPFTTLLSTYGATPAHLVWGLLWGLGFVVIVEIVKYIFLRGARDTL